jgi:hypothetical protein
LARLETDWWRSRHGGQFNRVETRSTCRLQVGLQRAGADR